MFLSFRSQAMTRCADADRPNVGALHGSLLTALGTAIVSGKYPPGQVLTLDGVSAEHGVSRSVAREAIRVLESMGMVESRRRVGITIQAAEKWNVFDPRADSLAARVRRPRRPTGVAVGAAAGIRAGSGGTGCPARRPASVPDHGGRGVGHGRARAIRRPRGIPVGGQDLSSDAARSQRQRDVPGVERRRRRGAHRPHPSRHDARRGPTPLPSNCTTRSRARSGWATARRPSSAMRAIIDEAASAVAEEFSSPHPRSG